MQSFKVILVGDYASGKSALHKRIVKGVFNPEVSIASVSSTFATKVVQLQIPGRPRAESAAQQSQVLNPYTHWAGESGDQSGMGESPHSDWKPEDQSMMGKTHFLDNGAPSFDLRSEGQKQIDRWKKAPITGSRQNLNLKEQTKKSQEDDKYEDVIDVDSEEEEEDEDGVDLSPLKTLNNEPIVKLQIWDTAGRDSQFNAMTKQQFQEAYAAIVVYDMTSRETLRNAKKWIDRIRENAPEDCMVILLENKIDLKKLRDIKEDVGPQLAKREDALFKRVSAKSGHGIDELVMKLTQCIYCRHLVRPREKKPSFILRKSLHNDTDASQCDQSVTLITNYDPRLQNQSTVVSQQCSYLSRKKKKKDCPCSIF